MEAAWSSKMLVSNHHTTWCNSPGSHEFPPISHNSNQWGAVKSMSLLRQMERLRRLIRLTGAVATTHTFCGFSHIFYKENEIGSVYSTHGRNEKNIKHFNLKI
jgi:hypothetical protein